MQDSSKPLIQRDSTTASEPLNTVAQATSPSGPSIGSINYDIVLRGLKLCYYRYIKSMLQERPLPCFFESFCPIVITITSRHPVHFFNMRSASHLATSLALSFFAVPWAAFTSPLQGRQAPADLTDVTTITSPNGAEIRYKEPGKAGVCETTRVSTVTAATSR